ncbi:MAG: aspartate carbamoyltransferase [Candidatus Staskawiczbacteria bacterium]|nr:aspartate carbamoyltransferase [Candidatus Staskawiczbacteria bacterium]
MSKYFDGWPHVIESQQFSREWLEREFLPLGDEMQVIFEQGGCDILHGKKMVSFFYKPSTRTRMSFQMAMEYLGGRTVFATENAREFSSARKGETLSDTIKVISRYRPDVIVIRYDFELGAKFASEVSTVPILNAGDREPGQHPTQALLDWRTIYKRRGAIDGLRIAMVGDLKNGRTVRSLCYLLGKFKGVIIDFISPPEMIMGSDVKAYLSRHGVGFTESTDLREIAPHVGAIYQTRTQAECGAALDRNDHELGYFTVDAEIVMAMKKDAIIMHPLPRVDEIATEVDSDPRAVYLTEQIDSGLVTRMALLDMILVPDS